MSVWLQITLVAFGSALGGVSRWGMTRFVTHSLGGPSWIATFVINVLGCFLIGWLSVVLGKRFAPPGLALDNEGLRLLFAVGFCGGFTTFSTFGLETHGHLDEQLTLLAIGYITASVFFGLLAVRFGAWLAGG